MKSVIKPLGLSSKNGKGRNILPVLGITALVLWGVALWSTIGFSLSPLVVSLTYIPHYLYGVLIGLILGDGYLTLSQGRRNARFRFQQGQINAGFFWHVFSLFPHYLQSFPTGVIRERWGKLHPALVFWTRSYSFFTDLHNLFYASGRKRIPWCISELLTPQGLAFWAMSDGSKARGGFYLSTNSFHFEEVQLLCNALRLY
jgi:hypothetical protein